MKVETDYAGLEKKLKQRFGERFHGTNKTPPKVEFIRTGIPTVDRVLGGGLPSGRLVEVFGKESCGKTALMMKFIEACQREGHKCLFIDAEHALDPEYARAQGVDMDELFVIEPVSAEESLDAACLVTADRSIKFVGLDSIASMVPEDEYKKDAEDNSVAPLARMLGRKVKQISAQCAENGIIFVAINQLRDTINGGQVTPGGAAFKYHASSRIQMSRAYPTWKIEQGGQLIGSISTLENKKCKVGKPFEKGNVSIYFGGSGPVGIDKLDDLINVGIERGVVRQSGSWFYFGDLKVLGKSGFREKILPFENELEKAIYHQLCVEAIEIDRTNSVDVSDD